MCRITFRQETVKRMKEELEKAYERGDKQAVRRLSVLIMIGKRMSLASILSLWNVSAQTVYNWLNEFARKRWESLGYEKAPGRPPRLTKTQKRKLADVDRSWSGSVWLSPDYNPIEYLWKKVEAQATHNRYFAEFAGLINSVDQALKVLAIQSNETLRLMGIYTHRLIDPSVA